MNIKSKQKLFRFVLYLAALWSFMPFSQVLAFPVAGGFGEFHGGGTVGFAIRQVSFSILHSPGIGIPLRQVGFTGVFYTPGMNKNPRNATPFKVYLPDGRSWFLMWKGHKI